MNECAAAESLIRMQEAPGAGSVALLSPPSLPRKKGHQQWESYGETRPIRVLLVDDHHLLTDALSQMLSREPDINRGRVAGSVAEAKAMARERLDVVLMDYRLPGWTGAEATRASRPAGPPLASSC